MCEAPHRKWGARWAPVLVVLVVVILGLEGCDAARKHNPLIGDDGRRPSARTAGESAQRAAVPVPYCGPPRPARPSRVRETLQSCFAAPLRPHRRGAARRPLRGAARPRRPRPRTAAPLPPPHQKINFGIQVKEAVSPKISAPGRNFPSYEYLTLNSPKYLELNLA